MRELQRYEPLSSVAYWVAVALGLALVGSYAASACAFGTLC